MDPSLWLCLLTICFLLQCPFGLSWKNLQLLDLGSNLIEGPLPASLCSAENLQYLLLSDNKLNGTIPECYGNISRQLLVLDLRKNDFHGTIPLTFPVGNQLKNLGLNGNRLEGSLPPSLINCKSLEVLDVGKNKIIDSFPVRLQTLPELRVLILKSNRFHGTIGISATAKTSFPKLKIFDISYNQFSGHLPSRMIENFQAMKRNDSESSQLQYMGDGNYYSESVTIIMKGQEYDIKRILTTFMAFDISGNQFEGDIPMSIGELNSLKVLNFSHNNFSGLIPTTLGDLSALETLDLSWNQLGGRIPPELGRLNFLGSLNLSENKLAGPIPQGGQFNTYDESSYVGNPGLCGFPLRKCGKVDGSGSSSWSRLHHTDLLDLRSGFTWKPILLGYCFGTILGLSVGVLMFSTRTPKSFVEMVEDMFKRSRRPKRHRFVPMVQDKQSKRLRGQGISVSKTLIN